MKEIKLLSAFIVVITILLLCFLEVNIAAAVAPPNSISMKIVNHAGSPIEVFWINTFEKDGGLVAQTTKPIRNSTDASINSYETHQFLAKFHNQQYSNAEVRFTKGGREETITITYDEDFDMLYAKQVTKLDEIMEMISEAASVSCKDYLESDDAFTDCISGVIATEMSRLNHTKSVMRSYRDIMAVQLREYVCADTKMNISEPTTTKHFTFNQKRYPIEILLDTDHAKIWTVKNMISSRECELLSAGARPKTTSNDGTTSITASTSSSSGNLLAQQEIAAGQAQGIASSASEVSVDGTITNANVAAVNPSSGAVVSSTGGRGVVAREEEGPSYQAGYELDSDFPDQDPLWKAYESIYRITNHATGYNLRLDGQEGFEIAHYKAGEHYGMRCDGDCSDALVQEGSRVATALLHCKVPEKGGALTFPKADIFIQPEEGMAVFFSYKGEFGHLDDGYTEHSSCPVIEGEKQVISLRMRFGVSESNPWYTFGENGRAILPPS